MFHYPHVGELGSAYFQVVLVAGVAMVLPFVVDRSNAWHRGILFVVAIALALRYAFWRVTETLAPVGLTVDFAASAALLTLEMVSLVGSLSAFVIMMRVRDRTPEADANAGWWGEDEPRVAILIATYNEELDVLARTIIGAKSLRHSNKEVLVLDDGRRDWLRDYCAAQGVRYMRRPDNKGSKAGNINHALARLAEDPVVPDFVAVLDADFVPHRGFISRTLALFHDPEVGLVQTPQHFFNADPIQHNLGVARSYPDEQRFFFDHMQASRDAWGIAFCCGTSSVCRWQALQDLGGLPTESVTEDFMLTLALQSIGWRSVYLAEPLTEGLAPEGLKEYVTQRARWCLGLMQIARSSMGPFAKNGLRLRDRWSVVDSVFYWMTTFPFRIAAVVFPLLYWFFNITVVDARLPDVISHFGTFYLWIIVVLNLLSRGMVVPILNDVSQLIGAIPISRAAFTGLLKPHGHPFSVTAKGGDRSGIVVQWRMMAPFAIFLGLTLIGLCLGIVSDRFAYNDAGDGKWVVLFWSLYNVVVLSVTIIACVELPRREIHIADAPERVTFDDGVEAREVWLTSLTADTARLRGRRYPPTARGTLEIADVGQIEAFVISQTRDGARVQLLPDEAQREALFVKFYAEGNAPGVGNVRLAAMASDLARRLSFSR
ncbi:glycosyltransferase [Roseivivax sediminis]|uniref:Cellulose synthase (UDP-forming) n=1 Tax=Roseivivax sediminis TaxID=936889 RepID=A0A1I2ELV2_9RHOB|nr:cellulose synthase catalytic subunit [Roseivivax sediminis]SFE93693.1 cellulose synthase (UDP-forming) [Roseivivax sediminis]